MIEPGTTVNRRYRLDQGVGAGGMAVVFRGHDLLLGRDVAIKVLRPQYAADPNVRARFEREAQAAAGFAHPNIIDIYDVGEEDGVPYIVMQFIRGQTLKAIIEEEGPFHPDEVASLLDQVCAGLDYAHERGYVHRDVKPQNILVDERGRAQVVDFGIAKGLADADLTEIGAGLGTVGYLSPEQASGLMATPASDVYSAAVVAFEMLTGRLPFEAETPVGVALRHVNDPAPAPSRLRPGLPPAVDRLVLRAMAKDPTRRFPSAGSFAREMGDWRRLDGVSDADLAPTAAATAAVVMPTDPAGTPRPGWREDRPRWSPPPTTGGGRGRASNGSGSPPLWSSGQGARPGETGDDVGCATWLTGTLILVGLVALIWFGFRLSPRLAELGGSDAPSPAPGVGVAPATDAGGGAGASDDGPTAAALIEAGETTAVPRPAATETAEVLVPVPELVGVGPEEAAARANAVGLTVDFGDPVPAEDVAVDAVARQDPAPGTEVAQGSVVQASLGTGGGAIDLAGLGLAGRPSEEAVTLLREEGLAVAIEEVGSADLPEGRVVTTTPNGRVTEGETVRLGVSVGDKVFLPGELQGQPLRQARVQVDALGLRLGRELGVSSRTIENQGVDLESRGIVDGDVVGVSGRGVNFNQWVERGSRIDLVYYDQTLDR